MCEYKYFHSLYASTLRDAGGPWTLLIDSNFSRRTCHGAALTLTLIRKLRTTERSDRKFAQGTVYKMGVQVRSRLYISPEYVNRRSDSGIRSQRPSAS